MYSNGFCGLLFLRISLAGYVNIFSSFLGSGIRNGVLLIYWMYFSP